MDDGLGLMIYSSGLELGVLGLRFTV